MQATEARGLLHKLTAAFPASGIGDDTIVLWLGYVGRVPIDIARPAVDSLIETCDRFPTVAQWQDACRLYRGTVRALPRSNECNVCEDGFLFATDGQTVLSMHVQNKRDPSGPQIKVPRSCPNGCRPARGGCPT